MDEMNIPLQDWINENLPSESMIYSKAWSNQVVFVRDDIPRLLIVDSDYEVYKSIRDSITVISTHTSKSIRLPVYSMRAFGISYIMRNNFHNWMISINSPDRDIDIDFKKLGIVHELVGKINPIYCEGFKDEWVYDSFDDNKRKFTIELGTGNEIILFFWVLSHRDLIWEKK